jgi:hypothetical protein
VLQTVVIVEVLFFVSLVGTTFWQSLFLAEPKSQNFPEAGGFLQDNKDERDRLLFL